MHPKDIAKELNISYSHTVHRIVKTKCIKQFIRLKTPYMNDATTIRRLEYASVLFEKFENKPRMTECSVIQDESGFLSQIPINSQNDHVYLTH